MRRKIRKVTFVIIIFMLKAHFYSFKKESQNLQFKYIP